MYAYNTIGRRRPMGWAERRRYFRKITEAARREEERKARTEQATRAERG